MVLDGPNGRRFPSSRSRARSVFARRIASCRRSRSPVRADTGSRFRARSARGAERRHEADARGVRGVLRGAHRPRCARARRRTTPIAPCRKGFLDRGFHLGHVTGPLDRDDDDRVPEDRRGRSRRSSRRRWCFSMHPHAISAGRAGVPLHAGHVARDRRRRRPLAGLPMQIFDGHGESLGPGMATADQDEFAPILPGAGGSDYERYLRTDELLALQKAADEWVHRDELLFQTVHQSSELWLKHACVEVEEATRLIEARDVAAALRLLCRANHVAAVRRRLPRASRADVAVGVPGGAPRARPRLRLRLARLPRDPPRLAAALGCVRRAAQGARPVAPRGLHAGPRARGSVPARRSAHRVGRAGRRLALPPLQGGRARSSARTSSARRARRSSCSPG